VRRHFARSVMVVRDRIELSTFRFSVKMALRFPNAREPQVLETWARRGQVARATAGLRAILGLG
jgi:hypothetical protein